MYGLFVLVIAEVSVHALEQSKLMHISKPTSTQKLFSTYTRKAFAMGFGMCLPLLDCIPVSPAYATATTIGGSAGGHQESMFIARKGAFEMDVELYIKNIADGNKGKTNTGKRTPLPTPRMIDEKFAANLLDIVDQSIVKLSSATEGDIEKSVNKRLPTTLAYFQEFVPLAEEKLSNEYYFDIVVFLHYLFAKDVIPSSEQRIKLREMVADGIIDMLDVNGGLSSEISKNIGGSKTAGLVEGMKYILNRSMQVGLIESYSFDNNRIEDLYDEDYVDSTFKEGLYVDFQFTLVKPDWILGWLEFQGQKYDTMFHPEFVSSVIQQWIRQYGYKCRFEDYPLDNYYRTDAVQAQDALVEMGVGI